MKTTFNKTQAEATGAARITAAKVEIIDGGSFFRPLLMSMRVYPDWTAKTARTDGVSITYNPHFVSELDHDETVTLLLHEVLHPALLHPWRRDGRDHRKWNIAADMVINYELQRMGRKLPAGAVIATGEQIGKSAEWIYSHLPDEEEEEQPPKGGEPGLPGESGDDESDDEQEGESESESGEDEESEQDAEDGEESGEGESGEGESEGEGESDEESDEESEDGEGTGNGDGDESEDGESDGDESDNPFGELLDAPTEADEDGNEPPTEDEWKQRVAQAARYAKARGSLSAGMERLAEDAIRPTIDVRAMLIQFLQERAKNDYSWKHPNPRYAAQGIYLPSLHDTQLGEVAILADTSSSMDNIALAKSRAVIESVIDELRPKAVTVWYADAAVARVDRFEQGEPFVWRPKGGGGTDFRPALAAIDKEGEAVAILGITDLDGYFPAEPPTIPTVWLSTEYRNWRGQVVAAPFGDTYYMND